MAAHHSWLSTRTLLPIVTWLLSWLTVAPQLRQTAAAAPPSGKPAYRILLNSDGGSGALYAHEPPITDAQLCRVIDALEGTQVDVFIQSVSFGRLSPTGRKLANCTARDAANLKFPTSAAGRKTSWDF